MTLTKQQPHLAILIAAPHTGEVAMHNDMVALSDALQSCGVANENILSLHGLLDRQLILALLEAANRRIATWTKGSVFLYYSGHGCFEGDSADNARPGLALQSSTNSIGDEYLYWDEIFAAPQLPQGVQLTLLPDL